MFPLQPSKPRAQKRAVNAAFKTVCADILYFLDLMFENVCAAFKIWFVLICGAS